MEQHNKANQKLPVPATPTGAGITAQVPGHPPIAELLAEKAVAEGRLEMTSNVLHDIGNGIVGFGSYITRIRRSLDQCNAVASVKKLAEFFASQQTAMAAAIGEEKAGAVLKVLASIADTQENTNEDIRRSITEQLGIITHVQEILHIQREYNGNGPQQKIAVNFRAIINDCIAMFFASLEKRKISISVSIPNELPEFYGHRPRLLQVMLNLLKNSIEAIDINAPEREIAIAATSGQGLLIITVRDNGHGFDEATAGRLFQRGFTTKPSGSGFGLNSSRAIIESYGGTIDIASEGRGKGAITTIHFKV